MYGLLDYQIAQGMMKRLVEETVGEPAPCEETPIVEKRDGFINRFFKHRKPSLAATVTQDMQVTPQHP
jgi:hypothetical protein